MLKVPPANTFLLLVHDDGNKLYSSALTNNNENNMASRLRTSVFEKETTK